MKPAVIVSLLMMFAILTFGKPANEDEQEAGDKTVTFYQKNLQSDSPNQKRDCVYRHFCGYVVRCCQGRSADENESGAKNNDNANEDEQVAGAKVVTLYKKNLQSDAPKDQAKRACSYIWFCGHRICCSLG